MEMDYNKIYNKILTDEEFMEIKQHGSSDYPFQYYYDNPGIVWFLLYWVAPTENLSFYMWSPEKLHAE